MSQEGQQEVVIYHVLNRKCNTIYQSGTGDGALRRSIVGNWLNEPVAAWDPLVTPSLPVSDKLTEAPIPP